MSADAPRSPLPTEPLDCRQRAEALLQEPADTGAAIAWALLAAVGELHALRIQLRGLTRK
ncbi:hypothetical protein [Yinghuangia sp. YIM S09857]|uniref:hypothetical protein n=1 Tax=Yinghuangia sp. YIM S09857 TaxID=3436929 RepID=UPI003F52F3DD